MKDLESSVYLRTLLLHASQLCQLAGQEKLAHALARTRINFGSNLACVFRVCRSAEQVLLSGWAVASLGPGSRAGFALEAVLLVRAAAVSQLLSRNRDVPWLRDVVEPRLRSMVERFGEEPRGKIERERAALAALESDADEAG